MNDRCTECGTELTPLTIKGLYSNPEAFLEVGLNPDKEVGDFCRQCKKITHFHREVALAFHLAATLLTPEPKVRCADGGFRMHAQGIR